MPGELESCEHAIVSRSVFIVDGHVGFRRAARLLLEAEGFGVIGEAADGESALTETARLRPGLVVLDIQLPDPDGFEVAARLASRVDPPAAVLSSYRRRLAGNSALGFIAKSDLSGQALMAFGM